MRRDPFATVQLKVRMTEDLRAYLADAAKQHGNSLNQEIILRLMRSARLSNIYEVMGNQSESEYVKLQRLLSSTAQNVQALGAVLFDLLPDGLADPANGFVPITRAKSAKSGAEDLELPNFDIDPCE